jgi:hypothetical protein
MTPDRVDLNDTDRLDALAACADRRVPRYPDGWSEGQQISPIGEHDFDDMTAGDWLRVAWAATRYYARQFWVELRAFSKGER